MYNQIFSEGFSNAEVIRFKTDRVRLYSYGCTVLKAYNTLSYFFCFIYFHFVHYKYLELEKNVTFATLRGIICPCGLVGNTLV